MLYGEISRQKRYEFVSIASQYGFREFLRMHVRLHKFFRGYKIRRRKEAGMVDRVFLAVNESVSVDTRNNTCVICSCSGGLRVYKDNILQAEISASETYTLPSETGVYVVKNEGSSGASLFIARFFVI